MTRYRFRGLFLLFLIGHATACATTTSTRTTSTATLPVYGSIPEFIDETQPARVRITTEDGTVYEVTRPSVEDNAINGDYIVRAGNNPGVRTAPIPLDEITEVHSVVDVDVEMEEQRTTSGSTAGTAIGAGVGAGMGVVLGVLVAGIISFQLLVRELKGG